MRYMPYTTYHVYSILKIENAAFLTYRACICDIPIPLSHMTLDNYSRRIALILTNNMSTIVIMTVFQLKISNVSLPIPNTCNYYYSMSGKWYVTLAILVSTISEKSNRSQKCKSTDCQSKNKYSLSHKETMMTWVSTQNDGLLFPIHSFYVYLQRSVHLKSLSDLSCIQRHNIPYFCRLSISNLGNNMAP